MDRTAVSTALTRDGDRAAWVPGPAKTEAEPGPEATGPAGASQVMNSPSWPTPASHERPEHLHQRRNRAMAWA